MYKCPNCGGEIAFLPETGKIRCAYCGSEFSAEAFDEQRLDKTRKTAEEHIFDGGRVYICTQCGANIYTTEETGVTFCSYCGSQAFLESRMKGEENVLPDLIIPFQISRKQCEEIYKKKIKSAWFLPHNMRSDDTIDKFRGIYMPCWIYTGEADANGEFTSVVTTREGSFDIVDTFRITANASGTYGGFVEDASSSFPDGIMEEIAPFNLKSARDFNDKYIAGYYADIGNVPPDVYYEAVAGSLDANVKNDLFHDKEMKHNHVPAYEVNKRTSVTSRITKVQKGFLPVWFLSNRNERTGLMSYAVVNGLTGKIHSDLPIDMKKFLLLALAIAVPVFLLLQFLTLKPTTIVLITMLLLCILMFFSTKMIRDKYIQEHGLDDEGLLYLNRKKKASGSEDASRSYYTAGKPPKAPAGNTSTKIKKILLGLLCFVGIPFLTAIFYAATGLNIIIFGFILGVIVFFIFGTGMPLNSSKSTSPGFDAPAAAFVSGKRKIKLPFPIVLRSIMYPLIGIIVGAFVLITQPVRDIYYYGTAFLCCIMLILTMLDFVRATNRLSLRKPAQLEKRGGDEDE